MQSPLPTVAFAIVRASAGLSVFLAACWLLSEKRSAIKWRPALWTLLVQVALAVLTQNVSQVRSAFLWASDGIGQLKAATLVGTRFVFGYIGGGPVPFEVVEPKHSFVFALQALPMVIVVSSLSMLMFHMKVLPFIVKGSAWFLRRTLGIGGALGVCAAAKVFLGQTEAPLLIRPYLKELTRGELFSVMTMGMATTSASVMVLYATVLEGAVAHPMSHILTASIISVPAALCFARILVPHTGRDTEGTFSSPYVFRGAMDAVTTGAIDGMKLFLNIIALLLTMLSLVALTDMILGHVWFFGEPLGLERILSWVMAPICWLMGLPWAQAQVAGRLLGIKLALNEVLAFVSLADLPREQLSEGGRLMMLYALSGFANLGSIGIQIGGFGTMVPERREEIIALGPKSMAAGALASCSSGLVVYALYCCSSALGG